MRRRARVGACLGVLALVAACATPPPHRSGAARPGEVWSGAAWSGEVWDPESVDAAQLAAAGHAGVDTVVLALHDRAPTAADRTAAALVRGAGLRLGYWLEVGRSPAVAAAHPEWQATLQGHPQWRRQFPATPPAGPGEVVRVWPWVPVAYAEAFAAHLTRVRAQLEAMPAADVVFLNDLQGPPSACGCGNVLCRWATDYTLGERTPLRVATPLGDDAAARFVAAVRALLPASEVVPVWVTECEEADGAADGACCGVGCYHGACWRAFDRQWAALRRAAPNTALLLPHRAFGRDLPRFEEPAGWVGFAIRHLRQRAAGKGQPIAAESLVAVLQGYGDVAPVEAQRRLAALAGVATTLVLRSPIDQSWRPQVATTK